MILTLEVLVVCWLVCCLLARTRGQVVQTFGVLDLHKSGKITPEVLKEVGANRGCKYVHARLRGGIADASVRGCRRLQLRPRGPTRMCWSRV